MKADKRAIDCLPIPGMPDKIIWPSGSEIALKVLIKLSITLSFNIKSKELQPLYK